VFLHTQIVNKTAFIARAVQATNVVFNQSIKQVYCTEPCHTYTINLTNENKRGKKSHMNIYK